MLENLIISRPSLSFGKKAHFQLQDCADWRNEFLGMRFSDYWEMILQAYISNLWIFRNEKLSRIYIFLIHQWFSPTIIGVRSFSFIKLNQTERRPAGLREREGEADFNWICISLRAWSECGEWWESLGHSIYIYGVVSHQLNTFYKLSTGLYLGRENRGVRVKLSGKQDQGGPPGTKL